MCALDVVINFVCTVDAPQSMSSCLASFQFEYILFA